MKTALFNNEFWKDDEVFELNSDTKLVYLCILTNPERNTTRFYRCPDRLLVAYTGYDYRLLEICKNQLEMAKLIRFQDGWTIIGDQAFIRPAKGKTSQSLYYKDLAKVPAHVLKIEQDMGWISSGAAQEYKDKDNNKDNNNYKSKDKDNNKKKKELLSRETKSSYAIDLEAISSFSDKEF